MATRSKPTTGLGPSSAYTTNEVNPAQVGRFTPSGNIPNKQHYHAQDILDMVVQILPERNWFVEREVTRSLFEDLHEPLSSSQVLTSFEDNRRKAFHELLRAFHDDFQVPHT